MKYQCDRCPNKFWVDHVAMAWHGPLRHDWPCCQIKCVNTANWWSIFIMSINHHEIRKYLVITTKTWDSLLTNSSITYVSYLTNLVALVPLDLTPFCHDDGNERTFPRIRGPNKKRWAARLSMGRRCLRINMFFLHGLIQWPIHLK